MTFYDDELMRELDAIQKEADRRKKAKPMEPYAQWKMLAQMEALARFDERQKALGA